ncbi:hypothetical protein [Micromonospora sp. 067-2]|uniref:hypothetical protein n=1 Tax=Micromonospora sp. 067-2 TaxID=2789270 RepID=UPI00397C9B32
MTNTGDDTARERTRLIEKGRRRSRRLTVVVVVALCTVPALLVVGWSVLDGERNPHDLLVRLLLALIPAAVGTAIALLVNKRSQVDPSRSSDTDATTLLRMKAALRDGRTDDLRIDALARQEAGRQARQPWTLWVLGGALALNVLLSISSDRPSVRWVAVIGSVAWAVVVVLQLRTVRRARRYLAGPPSTGTAEADHGPA